MPEVQEELPLELTPKNIIYWSEHYQRLEGVKHGNAIRTKARAFLKHGCIQYDPTGKKYRYLGEYDEHDFICAPIPGYNKTTYRLTREKAQGFTCTCQFYKTTSRIEGIDCSHITALWMQLKIWNHNRAQRKRRESIKHPDQRTLKEMKNSGTGIW